MSGLAKFLIESGCEVSGSDIYRSDYTDKLEALGAKVFIGHDEKNLPEDCVVVASTVIKEDNPELQKAKRLGLEILHRSDLLTRLADMSNKKYFMGFSGTHGKTTTSGLSSYVLEKAGLKPSFVVGGFVPEIHTNAKADKGDFFVAELDESDGTIIKYAPEISVINNLEVDHLDFFEEGLSQILNTFHKYLSNLKEGSKVIVNNDCQGNIALIEQNPQVKFITFGMEDADYLAKNIELKSNGSAFDIYKNGEFLIHLKLRVLGLHNVYNATAVIAALNEAGVDVNSVKEHFKTFTGMGRRFQLMAEFNGVQIFDDYAHHPTEIRAVLNSVATLSDKNIIAVFQPHRYTRLKGLWEDFLKCFESADKVYVTDVYSASEEPYEGINSANFVKALRKNNVACEHLAGNIQEVAAQLLPKLNENDLVIGLGAGTITYLGKELKKLL